MNDDGAQWRVEKQPFKDDTDLCLWCYRNHSPSVNCDGHPLRHKDEAPR